MKEVSRMKILFIGGTGTISAGITRELIKNPKMELYLLNRGSRNEEFGDKVTFIKGDINKEDEIARKIKGLQFDVIADFIGYLPEHIERDYRLFKGKTKQFIYISSASAYQKPLNDYRITEATPLYNPYWEYSRNKIACEDYLIRLYRNEGFPVTIIRPSHTYDERSVPVGVRGEKGSWQVIKRILEGKPVIIHGDGTSLWTMTHTCDFAKGFIGLMGNFRAIGETIHITSDETLTWNQIYQCIANALGVELNAYHVASEFLAAVSDYDFIGGLIGDKANSVVFDNSKLKRLVPDFVATKRFEEGIKETIDYILTHEECQKEDQAFEAWCNDVIEVLEEAKNTLVNKSNVLS